MHEGVELPNGGTLSVIINPYLMEPGKHSPAMERLRAVLPDLSKQDNRIIACALFVQERFPPPTVLVTKDVNVQLKARAVGLESEDYLTDKVPEDVDEASYREIPLSIYELQRFCSEGEFEIDAKSARQLYLNEYVLLRSDEGKTMPARYYGDSVVRRLKIPEFVKAPGGHPDPRAQPGAAVPDGRAARRQHPHAHLLRQGRHRQDAALDRVRAPPDAATRTGRYDGVSISRPVIALGKDIGFLPGTLEEKMKPWLQPYYDALEVLIPSKPPKEPQFAAKKVSKKKALEAATT
jgi:PhoH-like ATPase